MLASAGGASRRRRYAGDKLLASVVLFAGGPTSAKIRRWLLVPAVPRIALYPASESALSDAELLTRLMLLRRVLLSSCGEALTVWVAYE
jgi:hypothetical protein